jgi:hypothetical protein
MTYSEGRPWAKAIQEEALERRMPPWGAVKGFGEFRNDKGLTPEQLELIAEWVDGGAPEGEDKDLPPPSKFAEEPAYNAAPGRLALAGDTQLTQDFVLDGLLPDQAPPKTSFQVVAELPGGQLRPLLWMTDFTNAYRHPFLLRTPLVLPKGTIIRGIPAGAILLMLPAGEQSLEFQSPADEKTGAQEPGHPSVPASPSPAKSSP